MGYEIKVKDSRVENDGLKQFVEVYADSSADIPEAGENWAGGSLAYDMSAGIFYMLNSSGDWVNQEDFTVLGAVSTSAVAPTVSPASLVNRGLLKSEAIDGISEETEVQDETEFESLGTAESE